MPEEDGRLRCTTDGKELVGQAVMVIPHDDETGDMQEQGFPYCITCFLEEFDRMCKRGEGTALFTIAISSTADFYDSVSIGGGEEV